MEKLGMFDIGWRWLHWKKHVYLRVEMAVSCGRERVEVFWERFWPIVCKGFAKLVGFLFMALLYWKDCCVKGFRSLVEFGTAALFIVMWSCFISLTSMSCLLYVIFTSSKVWYDETRSFSIFKGAAGVTVHYLGYSPGLFIVGLFAILILWMVANFWIAGTLFVVGGYLFSLNHARLAVVMATIYAIYCVKVQVGWLGVFLSVNLAFISNDALNYLLQWYENANKNSHHEEGKKSETFMEDEFFEECDFSIPSDKPEKVHSCKSSSQPATKSVVNQQEEFSTRKIVQEAKFPVEEMTRILNSINHYEALGFTRFKRTDVVTMKREYRRKAMLVHPDKNMGSPQSSESFKKLQCAYEVLSDPTKKRDYDDQLRKEESKTKSVYQKFEGTSHGDESDYCSEESRCIHCTKSGNSHIWVCTTRSKAKARWCEVDLYDAVESKIFDVSEWATCQGMACRPNTHHRSFHVNMVGLVNSSQRFNSCRYPWNLDAEMSDKENEEFELWLQQALASGLFCETSKRRKSWSPFKLPQKKSKKQWRRSST